MKRYANVLAAYQKPHRMGGADTHTHLLTSSKFCVIMLVVLGKVSTSITFGDIQL